MRTAAESITALRLLIDGRTTIVEPANSDTVLFSLDGHRCAVTSRAQDRLIELTTIAPDEDALNDAAMARVKEAAARPKTPQAQRPSVLQASVRTAARQYHEATWNHGFGEGQARYAALPLNERVTEADMPELIELCMRAVLSNQALRSEFVAAAESADLEEAFAAQLTEH